MVSLPVSGHHRSRDEGHTRTVRGPEGGDHLRRPWRSAAPDPVDAAARARRRSPLRHLQLRRCALRNGRGQARVPRGHARGHHQRDSLRRSAEFEGAARNIPPILDRLVRHCLEKSPDERYQSARDIAFNLEALSTISPGETASATAAASAPAPLPAARGRSRAWLPAPATCSPWCRAPCPAPSARAGHRPIAARVRQLARARSPGSSTRPSRVTKISRASGRGARCRSCAAASPRAIWTP